MATVTYSSWPTQKTWEMGGAVERKSFDPQFHINIFSQHPLFSHNRFHLVIELYFLGFHISS